MPQEPPRLSLEEFNKRILLPAVQQQAENWAKQVEASHFVLPKRRISRWQRLKWKWEGWRERAGEIVAGRRFDDWD